MLIVFGIQHNKIEFSLSTHNGEKYACTFIVFVITEKRIPRRTGTYRIGNPFSLTSIIVGRRDTGSIMPVIVASAIKAG